MFYDVAHRHGQALDPSALSLISTTMHALTKAIEDCRNAGKDIESDAAVLLLARHLGAVAAEGRPCAMQLRRACMDQIADIRRNTALVALAHRGVGYDASAKSAFHAEGRRAMHRLVEALNLEEGSYEVRSEKGAPSTSGEITLQGEEVLVRLSLWPVGQGREVSYRRVRGRSDHIGGKTAWASVRDLVNPDRFAARLTRELNLTRSAEPTRLFA